MNIGLLSLPHDTGMESESATVPPCDPCADHSEVKEAKAFCVQCNNYQCKDCVMAHSKFASLKSHSLISLKHTNIAQCPVSLGKIEFCDRHPEEKIDFYCSDHQVLCCFKCFTVTHRKCDSVSEVKDMGRDIRTRKDNSLLGKMAAIQKDIESTIRQIKKAKTKINDQQHLIEKRLEKIRAEAIKNVNTIIDTARRQCADLRKDTVDNMSGQTERNQRLEAAIVTSNNLLLSVLERGLESQVFITSHKVEQQYRGYKEAVQREREDVASVGMTLKVDSALTNLLAASVYDTKGKVKKTYPKQLFSCRTENVALVDIPQREGLSQIPAIFGVDFLKSGQVILVDTLNDKCCLLDDEYCQVNAIETDDPMGVAQVSAEEVAVALCGKSLIQLIHISGNTMKPTHTIRCSKQPFRLARVSETALAVGWHEAGVGIISLPDRKEELYLDKDMDGRDIKIEDDNYIAVDTSRSRFYQTSWQQNALYSFEFSGRPVFTFKARGFGKPVGVAVDRDGNVCVCCCKDSKVYQVSTEGSLIRTIDVGIENPYVICFNSRGDLMTVVNKIADEICKLSVVRFLP